MFKTLYYTLLIASLAVNNLYAGKGYSSNGGRSYSSGGFKPSTPSFKPSTPSFKPSTPSFKPSSTTGKSYSSGTSYSTGKTSYSQKPTGTFQSMPAAEQKKVESRTAYQQSQTPKSVYTTPKGIAAPIKNDDRRVSQIRSMDHERWVTRETREHHFYHHYYGYSGPIVHYSDPYSTFFWLWLLDRNLEERAIWAYHHRADMDTARYRDLLAKDAKLEARIRQLEAEKVARDPGYVPAGMDPDLPYTDEYVNAAVNPIKKPINWTPVWGFLKGSCCVLFSLCGIVFFVWIIFYKRW